MVPNQFAVTIDKKRVIMKKGGQHWTSYYDYYFNKAFSRLNKGGLAVYCFLCQQVPHYYDGKIYKEHIGDAPFEFSPAAVEHNMGIDKRTAQRGWQELINLGYIVEIHPNRFLFKDALEEDIKNNPFLKNNNDNNQNKMLTIEEIYGKNSTQLDNNNNNHNNNNNNNNNYDYNYSSNDYDDIDDNTRPGKNFTWE